MERAPHYTCTEERQTAIFRRLPHTAGKWKTHRHFSQRNGLLYAAYHLIRLQEMQNFGKPSETDQEITENPAYDLRILNHWDNLDRSIERGYAGKSLWNWEELPGTLSDRYEAYARANASIGINATVLNNVNASSKILSAEYLEKVKALADIFRPYGIKVYLSINFASPCNWADFPQPILWTKMSSPGGSRKPKRYIVPSPTSVASW